jgi:hypothetical protein
MTPGSDISLIDTTTLLSWLKPYPGLRHALASLLEAAGPLTLLAAPLLRLSQPLLGLWLPTTSLEAAAETCEDPRKAERLAAWLRKEMGE